MYRGDNFCQLAKRSEISQVRREKVHVAAARKEKLDTHTHKTTTEPSLHVVRVIINSQMSH